MTESRRRLAAIMFTDMVDYTALSQRDEAEALRVLDRHNRLLRPVFGRFRGREIKTVGDAFLVEFDSALDAVQCAQEVQATLRTQNSSNPEHTPIRIRIGVHVGDVVQTDSDVLGDAVNIASRIHSLAGPDGICVTQQVYDQVQNKVGTPFVRLPPTPLKNVQVPITVYRIVLPWENTGRSPGARAPTGGRSLAVLPLSNISPDPNDAYFADGLTEELISCLSQVQNLSVIARTSVIPYKTAPKSIAEVGAELGVDSVLEGSVRKAGNRIRISLQLVDAKTQRHVWAQSYNRELDDVFAVQSDVAGQTADALKLELTRPTGAGVTRQPTTDLAAYDLYLRGLAAAYDLGTGGMDEPVRCYEQAIALDPEFAEAYAAWADLLVWASGDRVAVREVMPRARELAARALSIDPNSSDAHSALGNIAFQFDHDWDRAEAEFTRAIALNPSNVRAHRFYGLLLIALERFDEAEEVFRRAIQLDPGGEYRQLLAYAELESGNPELAIENQRAQVAAEPGRVHPHVFLGFTYLAAGRRAEAEEQAATPLVNANDDERFDLALLQGLVGRPELGREVIAEVERGEAKSYTSLANLAMMYAVLGETPRALDLLEQDCREGDGLLGMYYRSVVWDGLRDEPRFLALLREFKLPTHPIRRPRAPSPHLPGGP